MGELFKEESREVIVSEMCVRETEWGKDVPSGQNRTKVTSICHVETLQKDVIQ